MSKKNLEAFEAANETATRIDAMVELAKEKVLIIGGLDVATDRIEQPVLGWARDGEDVLSLEALRKDAERYRWFRDHSIQIVHTSTISWAFHLDKLIDDAMSPGYYAIRNQPDEV